MVHPQPGPGRSCPDVSVLCNPPSSSLPASRLPQRGRGEDSWNSLFPRKSSPRAAVTPVPRSPVGPGMTCFGSHHCWEEGEGSAPAALREAVSAAPVLLPRSRNRLYTHRVIVKPVTNHSATGDCEPRWILGRFSVCSWPFRNTWRSSPRAGRGVPSRAALAGAAKCKQTISALKITRPGSAEQLLPQPRRRSSQGLPHLFFFIKGAV